MSKITVCCPDDNTNVYELHPRVYLTLDADNKVKHCPYCQTEWNIDKVK